MVRENQLHKVNLIIIYHKHHKEAMQTTFPAVY